MLIERWVLLVVYFVFQMCIDYIFIQVCIKEYVILIRYYYNLVIDLYEYGWGQFFYFCCYFFGESFYQVIVCYEYYFVMKIGIQVGDKVLDVGCGIGGFVREIVKFIDCYIIGFNNNDYQIECVIWYVVKEGFFGQFKYVKGDFMVC